MKHVAVLSGRRHGDASESLASGAEIAEILTEAGYNVSRIDVEPELVEKLIALRPDIVFNVAQGPGFADGRVQGLCELLGIAYTHSGVLSSALAGDRHQTKVLFKATGLPVTDHVLVSRAEAARTHAIRPPYVVKPRLRDTGAPHFVIRAEVDLPPSDLLSESWLGGEEVMVERFMPGRTLYAMVMGDVALGVAEAVNGEGDRSGFEKGTEIHVPAEISPKIYEDVRKMTLKAHAALGCRGISRIAFRLNDAAGPGGAFVALDVSSQPALTRRSAVARIAERAGHSFEDFVRWIVEDASCNR